MSASSRSLRVGFAGQGATERAISIALEDPAGGFDEVVHDRIRLDVRPAAAISSARRIRFARAPPRADAGGELDVEPPIADDERAQRDRHRARCTARSTRPRPGFRQSQCARVLRHASVGMVRTIVIRVDARAPCGEQCRHVLVHRVHMASSKNPRATPDWFVTMTTRKPARLRARMASIDPGVELDALRAIR